MDTIKNLHTLYRDNGTIYRSKMITHSSGAPPDYSTPSTQEQHTLNKKERKMKTQTFQQRFLSVLSAAMLLTGAITSLMAAGTASGISISNSATVDYQVGAVAQPTITSAAYTFVVDNKVDLTVSTVDGAAITVSMGSNDNVMTYLVTNTGNTVQDYDLSAAALAGGAAAFGGNDNVDANTTTIVVESGDAAGYDVLDVDTYIDELADDANVTVYMLGDFGTGFTNGDIASYYLVATTHKGGGAAVLGALEAENPGVADTEGSVDIVFADGAGANDAAEDGIHSSQDDYLLAVASLSIAKSSTVISDPFNVGNFKRIPGAVVEYTLTISNGAGGSTATSIDVTDSLNTEIATNGYLAFNTDGYAGGQGIWIDHPSDTDTVGTGDYYNNDGSTTIGGVNADWDVTGTNVVTVTGISLDASESAIVTFRVTIQ